MLNCITSVTSLLHTHVVLEGIAMRNFNQSNLLSIQKRDILEFVLTTFLTGKISLAFISFYRTLYGGALASF